MSENATFGGDNPNEKQSNIKPINNNLKIAPKEFKQNIYNDGIKKIDTNKEKLIETQKLKTKEKLSELKEEIGYFEGVEPDTRMCTYTGLRIKFPGKNIKNIKYITSSTGGVISNFKQGLPSAKFDYITPSEPKEIEKSELINKDTIEFNWITPNTDNSILSFTVELEDGTQEIIKKKVKLENKSPIIKEPKKKKSGRNKKVLTEKIAEPTLGIGRFIGVTPDTRNELYRDLILEFSVLPGKEIKRVISIDTGIINGKTNGPVENISVIDGNKIKFDYLMPNLIGISLKIKVEFTDGSIGENRKNITLPNNRYNSPAIDENGIGRIEKSHLMSNLKGGTIEFYVFQFLDEDGKTWINDNSVWIDSPSINKKGELVGSYDATGYKDKMIRTHIEILKDGKIKNHDYGVGPI